MTRPGEGGRVLAERLAREGFRVQRYTALEIHPPHDPRPLDRAAERAAAGFYDWIVLTSSNGVGALAAALAARGGRPAGRIAAVGAATAAAAEGEGWSVELVPETFTAEGLLEALGRLPSMAGARVLLPVAESAREVLPAGLAGLGARVDVVVAYRTVPVEGPDAAEVRSGLEAGALDLVTFASPSAARAFLSTVGPRALELPAVVIGPVTATAAEDLGFRVVGVATPHTTEGLVEAVLAAVRSPPRRPSGDAPGPEC